MSYIKNTDSLVEGSSQLFFTDQRAQDAVSADLQALDAAIVAEETRAQNAEAALDSRLDVVEGSASTPGSIEKAKADAQAYADQKVADLVNSAPAVLDTLKELSDALGGDQNFAVTVSNQIGQVDDKVDQEISDRQAAVSAEQNRAQAAESALDARLDIIEGADSVEGSVAKAEKDAKDFASGLVSAEESARMAADASLSGRVSSLEADPTTKTYVDGEISAEQSARQSADSALSSRLDILEQDETTKAYVDQQVSAEQSARESADNLLDGRLDVIEGSGAGSIQKAQQDSEAYALGLVQAEESARQSAVSSEASARQSADSLLSGRLDALELDSVTKAYVDGEVSDLQGQITQEVSDRQSAVSGEASARQSADTLLSGRIATLEADPTTKAYVDGEVSSLQGQITQEVSDRQAAVSAEQSARESAINALDLRVDQLELDPVSKAYVDGEVSDLQGQVNTEKGRIDAILLAADADKDSFAEIVSLINSVDASNDSAFAGYVSSNNAALAQEVSDRQAGDSALDLRLDQLELDPVTKSFVQSADATLQSNIDNLFGLKTTSNLAEGSNLYYTQARFDSAFGAKSTTSLSEGSNLYYTQGRFDSAFSAKSTSDLGEGSNQYFTSARAKSAVVVDSSAGSQTDQAMSVSAAKSYIDAADNARLKLDGTTSMTGQFLATAGTVSAPGISFSGSTGYGMWLNGSSSLNLVFNGSAKLLASATGVSVSGGLAMTAGSNANMTWSTDGAGNIGASGANRPNVIYSKSHIYAGGNVYVGSAAAHSLFAGPTSLQMLISGTQTFTASSTNVAASKPFQMLGASGMHMTWSTDGSGDIGQPGATRPNNAYIKTDVVAGGVMSAAGYIVGRTAVSGNITLDATHGLLGVTSTSAARTISLPSAASFSGRQFIIKDESGAASATNYIRIQPNTSPQTLDGAAYYDITVPYESVIVYSNGSNWFIV